MIIKSLDDLIGICRKIGPSGLAVANAADLHVLEAIKRAVEFGLVNPILIGNESEILSQADLIGLPGKSFSLIHETDPAETCSIAVSLVKDGRANILMKGMVPTSVLLKAVLDKENGIKNRETLSHFALFQTSFYPKLIGVSDAAMNILPDVSEKVRIINNAVEIMNRLGVSRPKVAVLSPVEVVNPKITSTLDAAELTRMFNEGVFKNCIVYGPLALDNAVSRDAARQKGIMSEVAGDADILIAPDLNSGNILYKSLIFMSDGISAAVITGASAPIVLTSRADSEVSKLYSIALAAALKS